MNRKQLFTRVLSVAAACSLVVGTLGTSMNAYAYGEKSTSENTFQSDTDNSSAYQTWREEEWEDEASDSGKIALTPGTDETCLNFAWYSETIGTPAVQIWESDDTTTPTATAQIVTGTSTAITSDNANRQGVVYAASDKVDIENYLTENTAYCYRYTDNYDGENTVWSEVYTYETASFSEFSIVLTGDPQIGASSGDEDDQVARDTYNWNKTLETAISICPDAAFLLSAGDQIDTSTTTESGQLARESEYAGYLFPSVLRSLPVAATVGNHDMNGADYTYHFNNPNSEENLGATAAGGDYYFSYDGVLFISLNSNNRNQEEHRTLMEEAIAAYPDATWRVVVFHSDIYGSGEPHADTDASSNRIIFAPLMDEFDIDVCFTGHDHTYSRTYQIYNGTVIEYDTTEDGYVTDPDGTMYITTGSGSGSKYYNLLSYTPYYIAERTNDFLPSFSIVDFTETSLTISTYDYDGNAYADSFTIYKTSENVSYSDVEEMAAAVDTSLYTGTTVTTFETALAEMEALYELLDDPFALLCSEAYGTDDDPLYGYGSVNTQYRYTTESGTTNRLAQGLSTLIDKTIYAQLNGGEVPTVDASVYENAKAAVVTAMESLVSYASLSGEIEIGSTAAIADSTGVDYRAQVEVGTITDEDALTSLATIADFSYANYKFGAANVTLLNENGEAITLADGASITVTFNVADVTEDKDVVVLRYTSDGKWEETSDVVIGNGTVTVTFTEVSAIAILAKAAETTPATSDPTTSDPTSSDPTSNNAASGNLTTNSSPSNGSTALKNVETGDIDSVARLAVLMIAAAAAIAAVMLVKKKENEAC